MFPEEQVCLSMKRVSSGTVDVLAQADQDGDGNPNEIIIMINAKKKISDRTRLG
jgi:hypothetical protein